MNRPARRTAAIYARISTDRQNPLSPQDQIRKCREDAGRQGIAIAEEHIYVDEGLSGVGMDRPSLQRLLRAALSSVRDFDAILVDDTSRLSRSTESVLSIFRKLNFAGVQLIAVSQNIDSHHDQAETLLTIHGLIDSSYVRELAKKTHRGLEGAVLRGLSAGGRCYGYRTVAQDNSTSKRMEVEESEARVVRMIFEMSSAGYSLKGIAKKLNSDRAGNRGDWCPTGVRAMLKRELYKGEIIWNRSKFEKVPETNKRRRKMRDESEWTRIQRPELAIVSAGLWDFVQARFRSFDGAHKTGRSRGLLSRAVTSPYLFSGLLKCGKCGGNLIVATGGGTHRHPKYVCSNYFNRGTCENSVYIRREVLEERLLGRIQSELLRPEVIDYAISEFGRQLRAALANVEDDLALMRKRSEQLEREIARFNAAIAQGGPLESLVQQIATRENELKGITNKLLTATSNSIEGRVETIRKFVESRISDIRTLLQQDTALAKAELQSHLSEIRMTPTQKGEHWSYVAEGTWNLLGTGPNAPVPELAHSDGCGGWI
jgi:site-specific DNA recombinase